MDDEKTNITDADRSRNETNDALLSAKQRRDALFDAVRGRLAAHDLELHPHITLGRTNSGRLVLHVRIGRRGRPFRFVSVEFDHRGPLDGLSAEGIADALRTLWTKPST